MGAEPILDAKDMVYPAPPPDALPRLSAEETKTMCDAALGDYLADPSTGVSIQEMYDALMARYQ
jgi:hypothetical protein